MSRYLLGVLVLGGLVLLLGPRARSRLEDRKLAEKNTAPPRLDSQGDPLPPAAVLRLGSIRLQQTGSITALAFGKDDKVLFAAASGAMLRAWDPATGKDAAIAGLPAEVSPAVALAPGGRWLALGGTDRVIRVVDLQAGKVVSHWSSGAHPCSLLAFTADGRTLAWVEHDKAIHLRDLAMGRDSRTLIYPVSLVSLTLSGDGKLLAAAQDEQMGIFLWDTRTGKRIRHYPEQVRGNGSASVAFVTDSHTLVGLVNGKISFFETDSIERQLAIGDDDFQFTLFALSSDRKLVAGLSSAGDSIKVHRQNGGKLLYSLDNLDQGVTALAFSGDGKTLAVGTTTGQVRLWDLTTGKEKRLRGSWNWTLKGAGFSQAGQEVVTVAADRITSWSVRTGKALKHIALDVGDFENPALSADGQTVAVADGSGGVRIYDTVKGAQRCSLPATPAEFCLVTLSPNGRLVAQLSARKEEADVRLHDAHSGKQRLFHQALRGKKLNSDALFFGRDSRTLYTGAVDSDQLQVLEVSTGKLRASCQMPTAHPGRVRGSGWTRGLAFTPDGQAYALTSADRLALCDRRTARVLRSFDGAEGNLNAVAVSPNGRLLAGGGDDQLVHLWDLRTGRLLVSLSGHRGQVFQLAFSPDGRRLLSVAADSTVLVWDIAQALRLPPVSAQRGPVTRRSVETLWRELASEDASIAETAVDELVAQPGAAVRLLQKRLTVVPPVTAARLARLIQDLDSSDSAERHLASGQLAGLDEQARPALLKAAASSSAEVRRRVKQLLDRLDRGQMSGEQARPLRAVEVLERVGTLAARRVLRQLAGGAVEAALTRDADAALRRLAALPSGEK